MWVQVGHWHYSVGPLEWGKGVVVKVVDLYLCSRGKQVVEWFLDVKLSLLGGELDGYDSCSRLILVFDAHIDVKPAVAF